MPLYQPKELLQFLDSIGAMPNKRLSQNFLIDGNIIRNIVKAAHIHPGDYVLEIGPGPGSLTEVLMEKGAFVVAVETDRKLASALTRLDESGKQLQVLTADALKVPLPDIFALFPDPNRPIKLISNLPYHITTPLLSRFIHCQDRINEIIVMVQEEMGRRMSAKAGNKDYSALTVFLEFYTEVSYLFKVTRTCFYPSPKVDSAIISLKPKDQLLLNEGDGEKFFKMTRTAFGQRRKGLRNSLKSLYPVEKISTSLEAMGLNALTRPEQLSCAQFVKLFSLLNE